MAMDLSQDRIMQLSEHCVNTISYTFSLTNAIKLKTIKHFSKTTKLGVTSD